MHLLNDIGFLLSTLIYGYYREDDELVLYHRFGHNQFIKLFFT